MQPEWISARDAAELTGIAEDTIEWWIRQGRIHQRPRHGARPTLSRSSVEEFAAAFVPKAPRKHSRPRPKEPTRREWFAGFLSFTELASDLEVSVPTLRRWVAAGQLDAEHHPTKGWLRVTRNEAERAREEQKRWISLIQAAEQIGCTVAHARTAVRAGMINSRPSRGSRPCVDQESVTHYARETYPTRLRQEQESRDAAKKTGPQPPDEDHVWLRPSTVALVLRITVGRVNQLIRNDRLPHTRVGTHAWVRRDHLEAWAAARAVKNHPEVFPRLASRIASQSRFL